MSGTMSGRYTQEPSRETGKSMAASLKMFIFCSDASSKTGQSQLQNACVSGF